MIKITKLKKIKKTDFEKYFSKYLLYTFIT